MVGWSGRRLMRSLACVLAASLCRRLDAVVGTQLVMPHLLEEHEVVLALKQAPQIADHGGHFGGLLPGRAAPPDLPAAGSLADELGWLAGLVGAVG